MGPIFILPCSGRSGSTWIARLLTSSKEVLVWSETGLLQQRFNYMNSVRWTDAEDIGSDTDLHYFRKHGTQMWAAGLRPLASDFNHHWAKMMDDVFQKAAEKEGYPRWGLKEVSWLLSDITFIRHYWEDYRIIFLVRNFMDCYRSSIGTGWLLDAGKVWFIQEWLRMTTQIQSLNMIENKEKVFIYENLDSKELADWCDIKHVEKLPYIGGSSKMINKEDWDIINSFSNGINPLLHFFGYKELSVDHLYTEEAEKIPKPPLPSSPI